MKKMNRIQKSTAVRISLIFLVLFCQFYQMNFSCLLTGLNIFQIGIIKIILSLMILLTISMILLLAVRKWHIALLITSVITTVWSVANYYVVQFYGSPLFISEFRNFDTAMNVISHYHFRIGGGVILVILLSAAEIAGCILLKKKIPEKVESPIRVLAGSAAGMIVLYVLLFSPLAVKKQVSVGFLWKKGIRSDGFLICLAEDAGKLMHSYIRPEGYSAEEAEELLSAKAEEPAEDCTCPDIIFILNESFYDLNEYVAIQADRDVYEAFYGIEDAVTGRCVIPNIGGMTNNTEFVFLTGNSMRLLNFSAPFNYVELEELPDAVPRYVSGLGYETYALHNCRSINYHRHRAYPALGFEHIYFEDSLEHSGFGYRRETDLNDYRNLMKFYEEDTGKPKFMYLLTYQNHGGYEQNPDQMDQVHVSNDFGDLTDDVNEYLTSVQMSCKAIRELIRQLRESDRDVILCMIGDHAPSFITALPEESTYTEEEKEIRLRTVPFLMWTNMDQTEPLTNENMCTATDITAMVLKKAGLPLSPYHQHILDLHDKVPMRTVSGYCYDGTDICTFDESPYSDLIRTYYSMEYHILTKGE